MNERARNATDARTCSATSGNSRPDSCHFWRARTRSWNMEMQSTKVSIATATRTACSQTCSLPGSSSEPVHDVSTITTHSFGLLPRTFATANSKSSCVTCCLRSRSAYIPDNRHTHNHQRVIQSFSQMATTYQLRCIYLGPPHPNTGPSSLLARASLCLAGGTSGAIPFQQSNFV